MIPSAVHPFRWRATASWLGALLGAASLQASEDLCLPTGNDYIFSKHPERFYMHVDRIFEGEASKPWTGGCYGYVRNLRRIDEDTVVPTRLHEGIDIKPLKRDSKNRALDKIGSISAGKVVHVNDNPGKSNYGKYVVVEHDWENTKVYSLYAHFAKITCKVGQKVKAGDELGVMGDTGRGLPRERAHLHLELNLLMSPRYDEWARKRQMVNHHGKYNGINLTGCDIAAFYLEKRKNPELKFSEFVASQPVHFKVVTPFKGTPDFVERYPWICHGDLAGAQSWEISFSATGFPVAFEPSKKKVGGTYVTSIRPSKKVPHQYLTRWLISGIDNKASLNAGGKNLIELLMGDF
ncbi:MAG: M23 family metallopeptidase [Akkermansiaceae bacterium]|nr:M23 family metallopeptidase [Akkermansiaceae bacterium]